VGEDGAVLVAVLVEHNACLIAQQQCQPCANQYRDVASCVMTLAREHVE
jgi:hypothetical protein